MKSHLFLLCLGTVLVGTLSCSDKVFEATLLEAEQLMNAYPDSALALLVQDAAKEPGLPESQRAHWGVLVTQAQDKCFVPHTSDSLIREAANYYEAHGSPQQRMLAWYYAGRVLQDLGKAPQAQKAYLDALKAGESSTDNALLARIHSNLGMLYTNQNVYHKALSQMQQALQCLEQLNDSTSMSYVLRDIGRTYRQTDSLDLSLSYYERALLIDNTKSRPSILNELGDLYINKREYEKAQKLIREAMQLVSPRNYTTICLTLGRLFVEINEADSARLYLQKCISSPYLTTRTAAFFYLYSIARDHHQWEEYAHLQKQHEMLRDSVATQTYTNTLLQMQSLYDYQQIENERNQAEIKKAIAERNDLIWMLVAILSLSIIIRYWVKLKKKRNMLESLLKQLEKNQNKKDEELLKINEQRIRQLESLPGKNRTNLDVISLEISILVLINKYIEKRKKEKEEKFKNIRSSNLYYLFQEGNIKDINDTAKKEFVSLIEEACPKFSETLREAYPSMDWDDLFFFCMQKAGLKGRRMAEILYISAPAITMKRKRLAKDMFGDEKALNQLDAFINSL